MRIIGDLYPGVSGSASLGINQGTVAGSFDITTLAPFNTIHTLSGVFHDPLMGQSGVIRYNRQAAAFEVSVDGGLTFSAITTGGTSVLSIGVIGDTNLTGNVDVATVASGFMTIQDTADASPLVFSVNTLGLSGLWAFPTQGFNGRVINALTDFNGTEAQGVVNIVGASGIVVDIIGQTMTVTAGNTIPRCFAATFGAATTWTVTHSLNSSDVVVGVYDASTPRNLMIPDNIAITSANVVTITFNTNEAGRAVVVACP